MRAFDEMGRRAQFFALYGYNVLRVNYRGSSGRGQEFMDRIWDELDEALEDIAAGGRWLRDQDWIVEDRVGVFGHSFEGYLTYAQLIEYSSIWAGGIV